MAKTPIKYFAVDPWNITEKDYDPERNQAAESIFALANEYTGIRGFIEEGVSAKSLIGSYFNGIYENAKKTNESAYKGIIKRGHFMVNSVNWLRTEIIAGEERLDITKSAVSGYVRNLDLKSGWLSRSFTWNTGGASIFVEFSRFLSMTQKERGYQKIILKPDADITVAVSLDLDFDLLHWGADCYFEEEGRDAKGDTIGISSKTLTTNQRVTSAMSYACTADHIAEKTGAVRRTGVKLTVNLKKNECAVITRSVVNIAEKTASANYADTLSNALALAEKGDFERDFALSRTYWNNFWRVADVQIDGSAEDQQGIRFCLFQLQQTYQGLDPSDNIGAKGLTGEAYSGHAFWDTEACCLPFYLFNNTAAAKDLLLFRYNTLSQAKERAKMLDCIGACYPIATLNGNEACDLWQHASTQLQPSTAVAYGISHYVRVTGDKAFLYEYGAEMLVEISRFLLSRGQWDGGNKYFGYYGVMGPDEFQLMVNQNCYTNFMAKKTFAYTLSVLKTMKKSAPADYAKLTEKTGLCERECADFDVAAKKMLILYDRKKKLFEQHDGFFKLPHMDVDTIPDTDFPLYYHWSYDRIYRNDMIKQADVLMFMFLYAQDFTKEQMLANYEYYEPRCIHESSLSPSVHSVIAAGLGKTREATDFFAFATRMDIDDYNRNTAEGLHVTSIAAAWLNIVYGFAGLRSDRAEPSLAPVLPEIWQGYRFGLTIKGLPVFIEVDKKGVSVKNNGKKPLSLKIYGKTAKIVGGGSYVCQTK